MSDQTDIPGPDTPETETPVPETPEAEAAEAADEAMPEPDDDIPLPRFRRPHGLELHHAGPNRDRRLRLHAGPPFIGP